MSKIIFYGFSNSASCDVVPSLRKQGLECLWFGQTNSHKTEKLDYFVESIKHFPVLPRTKGFNEIHSACFEKFAYFLNMSVREYGKYFEKNFFDMLDEFNIYFNFYSDIVSKHSVKAILFSYAPHNADAYVLYCMAKALDIPTIIFYSGTYFPNKLNYLFDLDDLGDISKVPALSKTALPELKPGVDQSLKRMDYAVNPFVILKPSEKWVDLKRSLKQNSFFWAFGSMLRHGKWTLEEAALAYTSYKRKKQFRADEKRAMTAEIPKEPFVYFPLHLQPELVTAVFAGKYFDQVSAVQQLRDFIPSDWRIVVKEHPYYQSEYQRGPGFYQRLLAIPNVVFIDKKTSSHTLIEGSEFVASVTGAAGYEAVCAGKKALYFGKSVFKSLAGSFTYSNELTFEAFQKATFTFEELKASYEPFSQALGDGILDTFLIAEFREFNQETNLKNIEYLIFELLKFKKIV